MARSNVFSLLVAAGKSVSHQHAWKHLKHQPSPLPCAWPLIVSHLVEILSLNHQNHENRHDADTLLTQEPDQKNHGYAT